MSDQNTSPNQDETPIAPTETVAPPTPSAPHLPPETADGAEAAPSTPDPSLADTTGTGTIIALGCIGATLFLIVLGLLYLGITQLFG